MLQAKMADMSTLLSVNRAYAYNVAKAASHGIVSAKVKRHSETSPVRFCHLLSPIVLTLTHCNIVHFRTQLDLGVICAETDDVVAGLC